MENQKEVCIRTCDNYEVRDGEYIKDNMIYCKKCGEPKLYEFSDYDTYKDKMFVPMPRRVRVMCSCEQKELEREEQQKKEQKLKEYCDKLRKHSLLGERYKNTTFDNTDLKVDKSFLTAFERCKKYCENFKECAEEGYGIYLYGTSGGGKTHLMACMVNDLIQKLQPTIITNFLEISKEIRETYNKITNVCESELINELATVPFLFIDDIGTERVQVNGEDSFIQEKIYDIVNNRYLNQKPTIFSSNLSFEQLIDEKGMWQKTVDRIVEMSNAIIRVEGSSYRLKNRKRELPF